MMLKFVGGLIDRIVIVIGAIVFAQAPHFFEAYTQRLGGHAEELQLQLGILQSTAQRSGKGFEEYIHKFLSNSDPDILSQGEFMQAMQERYTEISSAYVSMINATPFSRPFDFIHHFQYPIAKMSLYDFQPGISFNLETGIYALLGLCVAFLFYSYVKRLFCCVKKSLTRQKV